MAIILLVLAGAIALDEQVDKPVRRVVAEVQTPMGARPDARSSAFFCTGGTAAAEGAANGTVVVANAGNRPISGSVTVVPNEGDARAVTVQVPAAGRAAVTLTEVVTAPYASALVELDGGQAVVELAASGPLGESISPCASAASTRWYFAEGITTRDATEILTLFNPFPEDAVVDMVFNTEEGEVTPQALTGLSVRGRGMLAINVGDHVQRRESVATRVSARVGRLVVGRLQTLDGSVARKGMSVQLGAAAPGDVWYFPEGFLTDGLTERFQLFNPSRDEAQVQVELTLEQGSAEPIALTVPGESRVTLSANDEARIPKNVPHAVIVRSTNGVGVLVERTIDATTPSPRSGLAITVGARVASTQAVVAAGQVDESTEQLVVVHNISSRPARVTVTLLDNGARVVPPSLDRIEVGPRQRRAIRLADIRRGPTPLLVSSTEPVVVERDLYKLRAPGTAMSVAIPLRP
ncbi:MAG: DUF5719 family protein [Actinomycetota bacterium]|nr:DUF5719 family protein [Actinomycetota bacterium]